MDGNNQPSHGFLSHILDPQLGQVFNNLVRSVLPSHDHPQQPAEAAAPPSSQPNQPLESSAQGSAVPAQAEHPDSPVSTDMIGNLSSDSHSHAFTDVQSSSNSAPEVNAFHANSAPPSHPSPGPSTTQDEVRDVEMNTFAEHSPPGARGWRTKKTRTT
ncbi:hypothetical protein NUW54_g10650 [Trametes sanguinea]|uniref:Uncharacterized protein n=1 Tax=Trametes sanguinea TaxID=158606 RepID=A0ACC1NXV5_9APHY|nr:hypothetical protein NUW54_g10650 [Trametes sanguinea]